MFCHSKALDERTLLFVNPAGLFVTKTPNALDSGLEETRIGYITLNADGSPVIVNEIHLSMRDLHARIQEAREVLEVFQAGEDPEHELYPSTSECLTAIALYQGRLQALDSLGINAKIVDAMQKLVARAHTRFVIKEGMDGELMFSDVETKEYYVQAEAKRMCRDHNNALKDANAETGYLTPEDFYHKVVKMYSVPMPEVKSQRKVAKV